MTLTEILELTGKLDDGAGEDTARARFRRHLAKDMKAPGAVRDYVEECLRNTGDQYNRALQDLVNHIGTFLGFDVEFGRYQGVAGAVGFDGLWASPGGFFVVVESKTSETYSVKTKTLVGYVDELISEGRIPSWDHALGLYVVGRPDPELNQLANAIVAEKRTHQLRILSANSLLSLAELMQTYEVSHEDILALLRPSGPSIDPVVELINRVVAGSLSSAGTDDDELETVSPKVSAPGTTEPTAPAAAPAPVTSGPTGYWLTPVASDAEATAEQIVQTLVGKEKVYAFSERTPGRTKLKPGDGICFYAGGTGVIAHATVASAPTKQTQKKVRDTE
ncbi:MAG: hypothetical protein WBM40_01610, partial [Thiohalocapsa sp.]